MARFIPSLLTFALAGAVLASPLERRDINVASGSTGNYGGYYYSFYNEANTGASMDIGNGVYNLNWQSSSQDIVAGIGWETGSAHAICYSGWINADGDSVLALYGWTTNPLIEYYVIETYGTYNPGSSGNWLGTVYSDDSTYDIYETTRTNAPSIEGTQTFHQYLSIRQIKRTSGTITFQNHINAWAQHGLNLGDWNYQIMATEGYESNGSSSITINYTY